MQDYEMVKEIIDSLKIDMKKAVDYLSSEYQMVRAGRANPHILDKVQVEYYGSMTPINQMANISVPEARMLLVSVWDQSQLRNVSKAIMQADLGITPSDDGRVIRLVFPALTEERRRDIVKDVRKLAEECKVALRNNRRDALDMFKQMKKDGELTEDDMSSLEKDVQKIIDDATNSVDSLQSTKEKEIMEI